MPDLITDGAWGRIQTARERLTSLNREMQNGLREAKAFVDDHLTDEGLHAKRSELRDAVRSKFEPELSGLRQQIKADHDTLTSAAEKGRPRVGDDASSLMRAQTRWDQARMKLEAGMTLHEVVAAADTDDLLAIREWAPTWMTVQAKSTHGGALADGTFEAPDPSAIEAAIDSRLAETAGGDFGETLTRAREAAATSAYATPMLNHLDLELSGDSKPGSSMNAAVEAHYAAQSADGSLALAAQGSAEGGDSE